MIRKPFFALTLIFLSFILPAEKKHIKVFLIGDSTMCNFDPYRSPLTGWGTPFSHFFDSTVTIDNRAIGGRSTRTFLSEQRWQPVADSLQKGDYVFIQFGHNDEAKDGRMKVAYTPVSDYKINLIKFISETRAKQALPVLITPVTRWQFNADGTARESHLPYTNACYEIANQYKVPLIDLDKKSRELLQKLGQENSKLLFLMTEPDENPHYPNGITDSTHYNEYGARIISELVLSSVRELNLELSERIGKPEKIE